MDLTSPGFHRARTECFTELSEESDTLVFSTAQGPGVIDHDIVSAWLSLYSVEMAGVVASSDLPGVSCLGWLATMQLRATLSNSF